jgi:ribosome biogenesis GTPase A
MNQNEENSKFVKTTISWYPGHMAKTKRLINETGKIIDIVYEIIDARIPYSSKNQDLTVMLPNKPHILIMTKYDLCDEAETNKWVKYYQDKKYQIIKLNLNQSHVDFSELIKITNDLFLKQNNKRNAKGMLDKEIHALVCGVPNVGKSTFINRFVNKTVANVGNKPGVTTKMVWLKTNSNILMLDTPGILWPKLTNNEVALNLAAMSAIREEIINVDDIAWHILNKLNKYYPQVLNDRYGINKLSGDFLADYEVIGTHMHALIKGGEIDIKRVSNNILNDLKLARITGITFDRWTDYHA